MILLSAHKDTVFNNYQLEVKNNQFTGLLDNFIGMTVANMAVLTEPNLLYLLKEGELGLFYSGAEEWGMQRDLPAKLTKNDIVIVVDVCAGKKYKKVDFSLENISDIPPKKITQLWENLKWEGFNLFTRPYTGKPDDEDEAFQWHELGVPVISFIIPIDGGPDDQWHTEKCSITFDKVLKAKHGLTRLINYLL